MSAYDSAVVGKLKLKGKPLDVKAGGTKKKKMRKKHDKSYHHFSSDNWEEREQEQHLHDAWGLKNSYIFDSLNIAFLSGQRVGRGGVMQTAKVPENIYSKGKETSEYGGNMLSTGHNEDSINDRDNIGGEGGGASYDDHLTPAERRYFKLTQKLELQRLAKVARSSHRDRIQEFNQYLANLSEHYDIPKVGPG